MDKDEQRRRFWRVGGGVLVAVVVVYFAVAYWQKWPPFKAGEAAAGEAAAAGGGGVAVAVVAGVVAAVAAVAAVGVMWRRQGRGEVEPKPGEAAMILHGVGVSVPPRVVLDGKVPSSNAVNRHFQRTEGSTGLKSFFSGLFRYISPMRPVQDMFWNRSGPVVKELSRRGGKPLSKKRVRELADNRREGVGAKRRRLVGAQSSWGKSYYKTHLRNTNAFVLALDTLSVASKKERDGLYDEVLARARSWEASYKVYARKEGEVPAFRGPESGDASEAIQSAWVLSMLNERNALKALGARPGEIARVERLLALAKKPEWKDKALQDLKGQRKPRRKRFSKGLIASLKNAAGDDGVEEERKKRVRALLGREAGNKEEEDAVLAFKGLLSGFGGASMVPSLGTEERIRDVFSIANKTEEELEEEGTERWIRFNNAMKRAREEAGNTNLDSLKVGEMGKVLSAFEEFSEKKRGVLEEISKNLDERERQLLDVRGLVESPVQDAKLKAWGDELKGLLARLKEWQRFNGGRSNDKAIGKVESLLKDTRNAKRRDLLQISLLELKVQEAFVEAKLGAIEQAREKVWGEINGEEAEKLTEEYDKILLDRAFNTANVLYTDQDTNKFVDEPMSEAQMELLTRIRDTFEQDKATLNRILYLGELRVMREKEFIFLNAKKEQIKRVNEERESSMSRFNKVTKFMEGEVKKMRALLETGAKNEEEMEADLNEMRVLLDETEEADESLEVTIKSLATRAKLMRFNALQNLPSLAKMFEKYADVMDAEVDWAQEAQKISEEITERVGRGVVLQEEEIRAEKIWNGDFARAIVEKFGSPEERERLETADTVINDKDMVVLPLVAPTVEKAKDVPVGVANVDVENRMLKGIHALRLRRFKLAQNLTKEDSEHLWGEMRVNDEMLRASREMYTRFVANVGHDEGLVAKEDAVTKENLANFTKGPGKVTLRKVEDVPSSRFCTLDLNTLAVFASEMGEEDPDFSYLESIFMATRGLEFEPSQKISEEVLYKSEIVEAYSDRRAFLADVFIAREVALDLEEEGSKKYEEVKGEFEFAIERMREQIIGFEKDLGLARVSAEDELQTLEHTAATAQMYLVNSRVGNLFSSNWEMKDFRDNAGEVLRKDYTSGTTLTVDRVLKNKGVVY